MRFSSKAKTFVCEFGDHVSILARLSGRDAPLTVEGLVEFKSGSPDAIRKALSELSMGATQSYLKAICGISPEQRFVRRATLDPKRLKETEYLAEVASTQFRIEESQNVIAVLNAFDGLEFDPTAPSPGKEIVFCGLPTADAAKSQDDLLACGIYPDRLELSSVAAIGAINDYLRFNESAKPTIVLELGAQSTQSYIVSSRGLEASRPIAVGLDAMVPVVQKELGLKDEESAKKLFFSNTFDFTGMGASLCKRLLKELQSSMGFYEVQTGQSIGQLVCTVLPPKLEWLEAVIASQIGVSTLQPNFGPWLAARGIKLADTIPLSQFDARKLALLGLIIKSSSSTNAAAA